jgi:flagella basal body P-ring formation protein FlgA
MNPRICLLWLLTALSLHGVPAIGAELSQLTELHILERVMVRQKQVMLLDLISPHTLPESWKEAFGKHTIGDSPSVSSEKIVDPEQLRSYLTRFIESQGVDPSSITIQLPQGIVVTRESVQLSQEQIEGIYRKFVMDNAPWDTQDIVIQKVNSSGLTTIPAGELSFEVVPNQRERFIGNVGATINFFVDGEKVRTLNVMGKVEVYQNIVHAARAMRQNDVIAPKDIEFQRINISDGPDRYATHSDQVINKRLLRNVGLHQPISLKDLDKPLVLKRGDMVTIIYTQPGLKLTAKGEAKEDGAVGDSIRIDNINSKKTIYCRVIDSQTVQAAH